mgnify:CR=1 FL=1
MNKNFIQQIKCLFIILFISCFCLSTWGGELHAQNPKLTLKFRDAGMEQIMNEIEKQINYYFIVDKGVDIKRTLTIDVTDKPLTAVLDQLVAGTDTRYRVYQQNIYLSVVKRDASKPVRISGKVIDARGEPVVGASVVVRGTTLGTSTGIDGAFSLQIPAPAETDELLVNFIGALTFSIFGYFYIKRRGKGRIAKAFIPTITTEDKELDAPHEQLQAQDRPEAPEARDG